LAHFITKRLSSRIRRKEMPSQKQKSAARKNIKKAAAAKRKRTIAHLPKSTRSTLRKQASKIRKSHHG
jgi:hypothetical protein